VCAQPVAGLHESAVHSLASSQLAGGPPVQTPAWHVSLVVQALASSHLFPFGFSGLEQTPVTRSQVPTSWHWSRPVQTTGFLPIQVPL
jgi:hypothetical protein